jgi:transketolase
MSEPAYLEELTRIARRIRRKIIEMAYETRSGHIGPALSSVEILTALYFHFLNSDFKRPEDPNRDRFILSKGHAANALYAALYVRGVMTERELRTFLSEGSFLGAHPTYPEIAGIEFATGSLGHGLPVAVGLALAAKRDRRSYRVITLLSDGECEEGSTWEAALSASQFKLGNLIVIIDFNKLQATSAVHKVMNLEPFLDKWKAFGFSTQRIDGHNIQQIVEALSKTDKEKAPRPNVIIADTIKGKGISFLENTVRSHYHVLTEKEYLRFMEDPAK